MTLIIFGMTIAIGLLGLVLWVDSDFTISEIASLSSTNRTANTYFGALITAMALIITLTSNLYSPRLAKVFVTHPLTILGIGYILLTNFFITVSHLITQEHPWFRVISFTSFTLTIIAMLGVIPFLFLISRFVKPSYFIPLMGEYAKENLDTIHRKKTNSKKLKSNTEEFFTYIDVINNMASTAIQRKDRTVLSLVSIELFELLKVLIANRAQDNKSQTWRSKNHVFTHGLSEEGKYYLKKYKTWPETYILSKILENVNLLEKTDNEIVPMICREITNCSDLAINNDDEKIVRLLLTILNSMLRGALEDKNEYKFSSVMYYYRMNIELLIGNEKLCNKAIEYFLHYGSKTIEKEENFAAKNFLFDLGRIINYISFEEEKRSVYLYKKYFRKTWQLFVEEGGDYREFALKSIIKTFWNLYSQNYHILTSLIRRDFLKSNYEHAMILKRMLRYQDPLDIEYHDTLVCVEYLSGMAQTLSKDFLSDFIEIFEKDEEEKLNEKLQAKK